MCSFIFRHEQKPLTLINPTLTRVISPIEMSTMIIQVELSAVPTEIKKSEDFRNRYSSAIILK
jgi:hypothetical protein